MIYSYHIDPGHGWVEVSVAECVELKITDKISSFSYRSDGGCILYLEEDCDARVWQDAYFAKYGEFPEVKTVRHDHMDDPECFILSLRPYVPYVLCPEFAPNGVAGHLPLS